METIQEDGCYVKELSKPYLLEGSKPLIRALKWGTVWTFASKGIKTNRGLI